MVGSPPPAERTRTGKLEVCSVQPDQDESRPNQNPGENRRNVIGIGSRRFVSRVVSRRASVPAKPPKQRITRCHFRSPRNQVSFTDRRVVSADPNLHGTFCRVRRRD